MFRYDLETARTDSIIVIKLFVQVPGKLYLDLNFFFWILLSMLLYIVAVTFFGRYVKLL